MNYHSTTKVITLKEIIQSAAIEVFRPGDDHKHIYVRTGQLVKNRKKIFLAEHTCQVCQNKRQLAVFMDGPVGAEEISVLKEIEGDD